MSYNSCRNKHYQGFQELNELFNWVFDSEQYEVGPSSSSNNIIDLDFIQPTEQFDWTDESKLLKIDDLVSQQISSISSEEFTSDLEKLHDPYFWDDFKLSEVEDYGNIYDEFFGDIFDSAFEKLNQLFSGVDDYKLYKDGDSDGYNISWDGNFSENRDVHSELLPKPTKIGSEFEQFFGIDDDYTGNYSSLSDGKLSNDLDEINDMLRRLTCVTVEPEFEEDLYLRCRKDAINMMRAATQHLNEAKNAFLKGDHISAKTLSRKAKEERKAAQRLHTEAAREILNIKNKNNGIMKLDLHCLHVPEAIQAVKERLQLIETQKGFENSDGKLKRQRLEVVTGRGKHSTGAPKLPGAVRSFLKKNGYHFDASRAGVIMVRPKLRAS